MLLFISKHHCADTQWFFLYVYDFSFCFWGDIFLALLRLTSSLIRQKVVYLDYRMNIRIKGAKQSSRSKTRQWSILIPHTQTYIYSCNLAHSNMIPSQLVPRAPLCSPEGTCHTQHHTLNQWAQSWYMKQNTHIPTPTAPSGATDVWLLHAN